MQYQRNNMGGSLIISGYNFYQVLIAMYVHFWQRIKYEFVSSSNESLRQSHYFFIPFFLANMNKELSFVNFHVFLLKKIYTHERMIFFDIIILNNYLKKFLTILKTRINFLKIRILIFFFFLRYIYSSYIQNNSSILKKWRTMGR